MRNLREDFRIGLDKALLHDRAKLYRLSGGRLARSMFRLAVPQVRLKSKVVILDENEESVTIAKKEPDGSFSNEPFRILSTTDFHLGDDPKKRNKTFTLFVKHIKATRPDLVILTGDLILSKFQHIDAIQFAQMMEDIGVYWAFVFGNHEAREPRGPFKHLLMECKIRFPHCLSRKGPDSLHGYVNFHIDILRGENDLLKSLFLLDSGRDALPDDNRRHGFPAEYDGYDYLKKEQIAWYLDMTAELKEKYGQCASFLYIHIPLCEYERITGTDADGRPFRTGEGELLYGDAFETVGSSGYNTGMFDAMKRAGGQAVFAGHDHVNDWCAELDGIRLVYNQFGGYETYTLGDKTGAPETQWPNGVTITDIAPDGTFDVSRRLHSLYPEDLG